MKKIFIISSIIMIFLVITSFSYASDFKDVQSTKFEKAVDVLTSLSIINGYNDGTYRPNNPVTRAEMAKLIIVAIGKDSVASSLKGKTQFSDVVEGGWASGYINCATSQELIKGYPDGSFKPNNSVTYAEAATMLLRALNYTKELENETYPAGYMEVANKVGILKDVNATKSSDNATRGYIANMIFNTLKAGTRKIVSTTTNGKVNYGDDVPLVEKSFNKIKCIKEGTVAEVDLEEEVIKVKDTDNNRRLSLTIKDKDLIKTLLYRKVDIIYDENNKEFLSFEIVDDYTIKEVEIDEIRKDTIYAKDGEEYDIPDEDDVLMSVITNYDEAETAFITFNGEKVLCVLLEGTPKVYPAYVLKADITVDGEKGIEVSNADSDTEELVYSDDTSKAKVDEFILYSLDNEKNIVVRERITSKDASIVEKLTMESGDYAFSLKLRSEKKSNELKETDEYYIYQVTTTKKLKELKLEDIDTEFDLVAVIKFAEIYYIVDFEDSVDSDDIVSKLSVSEAKEKLEDTIDVAKKYIKKESSYSVETFEPLNSLYNEAVSAVKGSTSAAKLEVLDRRLNEAIDGLKSASSEDKSLRNAYDSLQYAIKEAESKKAADYTTASFSTLTTELKNAKAITLANTTVSKIETRTNALNKAINMLVTIAANNEIQSQISRFNTLKTKAETLLKSRSEYTDASANDLNTALTNAKKLNTSTATLAEIKTQCSNLEASIDGLVSKSVGNYETAKNNLKANYDKMMKVLNSSGTYTEESYANFIAQREEITDEYDALPSVSEVSNKSTSEINALITKINNLNTKIANANKLLVNAEREENINTLKSLIEEGEAIKQEDWTKTDPDYASFRQKLANYKKYLTDSTKTNDDLTKAILDLVKIMK